MKDKMLVAISSDFLTAFAALPRQIQGKVIEFFNKFRNNPLSPGINLEKIKDATDKKIYSVRIDDTYRGIIARQEESGVFLLLWVDHHDEAYLWAKQKKCEINPLTGNIQVYDINYSEKSGQDVVQQTYLFSTTSDQDLLKLGVPSEQIKIIRSFETIEDFIQSKNRIPEDAYEGLEWIANGFTPQDVFDLQMNQEKTVDENNDFVSALDNPRSQKTFVIVEGEEELRKIMAEPLEKWRVFLHPTQRKIVNQQYSGPARVLGGAGTGKTVVAMHRAKWLAGKVLGKEKILFTTFTANLAGDIKDNLRKICNTEEIKSIDVINFDAWVAHYLREQGYLFTIAYDDVLTKLWEEAIVLSGEETEFSSQFYTDEWEKIISTQEAYSLELYIKANRLGRGTRLDRSKRIKIWKVFKEYQYLMKEKQLRDIDTAMYECRIILEKSNEKPYYTSIVIDEGQDLSMSAYRLFRALAGPEHINDLFIVGDTHQRIYKNKAILSKCGINIRGRSSYLKLNYRTTEEVRKYAFSILKGISFDDLDDKYDEKEACQSLTHGTIPQISNFRTAKEEVNFIVTEIKRLINDGVNIKDICIVARTHRLLDDYIAQFTNEDIRSYEIKRNRIEDRSFEGIRVATMHRVKGLEFQHIFVVAVNKNIIPLKSAIDQVDQVSVAEAISSEKCLLYVALTRAQKSAYITSYGTPSEFLV